MGKEACPGIIIFMEQILIRLLSEDFGFEKIFRQLIQARVKFDF